ncbi:MAG: hypothetical protein WDO19_26700 [Bacteroidota bacterium]
MNTRKLHDERDRYYAMKLFVDRMIRMKISETAIPPEISGERVHPRAREISNLLYTVLSISESTGRYEKD